jgi:hypothetical protein
MKLICAAKQIPFEVQDIDYQKMKEDRTTYPFGQAPRSVSVAHGRCYTKGYRDTKPSRPEYPSNVILQVG